MKDITAEQKIKWLILELDGNWSGNPTVDYEKASGADIDASYDGLCERGEHWDAMNEIREGSVETEIDTPYSRHYESKSVASRMPDGSWVGWTYWYGGGKHGEPEAVDWMDSAYDLLCAEEEKVVTVRTFSKLPDSESSNRP